MILPRHGSSTVWLTVVLTRRFTIITSEAVKALAYEVGFDLAGVTRLEPEPQYPIFCEWLARGCHAEMRFLERNRQLREDPRLLLPKARSALVVGLSYYWPANQDSRPAISRYARGLDYHAVVCGYLKRLAAKLTARLGASYAYRICVDTAPVMERSLAQRAGLGWIGKNHCLITKDYGSYVVLGELLLDFELEPDAPQAERCGDCRICLNQCPTKALTDSGYLDSRRCLSYLTIEHRGELPREYHPYLAEMVFGCDRCQDCCPWNLKVKPARAGEFKPRLWPPLARLPTLPFGEVQELLTGTALRRTPIDVLMRNIHCALEAAT